jgi:hypothetical protein
VFSPFEDFSKGTLKQLLPSHLLKTMDGYTDSGLSVVLKKLNRIPSKANL